MLDMQTAHSTDTSSLRPTPSRSWQEPVAEGNLRSIVRKPRINQLTPDLFSQPHSTGSPAIETIASPAIVPPQRDYLLPRDLAAALKTLSHHELTILGQALMEEQGRRKGKPYQPGATLQQSAPSQASKIPRSLAPSPAQARKPARAAAPASRAPKLEAMPLTRARVSAVRAAFKAGVKPGTIARQFGATHAQVREALAGD